MVRSRAKYSFIEDTRLRVGAVIVVGLLLVWFGGPWLRDAVGHILVSSSLYREYALVPHDVLASELRATKDQLNQVRYQSVLYEALETKYRALLKESGMRPSDAYLTARVAAVPPHTVYDTILITAGSADGVLIGDRVTTEDILVGSVTTVGAHSAVVTLTSSPGSTHDFKLGDPASIVVGKGLGGGAFETTVPGTVVLAVGDSVTDSASGYVVALVASVDKQITDTAAHVRLRSPIAVSALTVISLTHHEE